MSWHKYKWWRFAISPTSNGGIVTDADGSWKGLCFNVWILIKRGNYAR